MKKKNFNKSFLLEQEEVNTDDIMNLFGGTEKEEGTEKDTEAKEIKDETEKETETKEKPSNENNAEKDVLNVIYEKHYYVVLLKDLYQKIMKLKNISSKILNKQIKQEAKFLERLDLIFYLFKTFLKKYQTLEDSHILIFKFRRIVNAMILWLNKYILRMY